MSNLKWKFASTGGGSIDGVNNPMISHFTGNYNYHLAREIIQNSLDAKLDEAKPVEVKFGIENLSKNDFPGHDHLLETFELCKQFWPSQNKDAQSFISNAIKCLNTDKISFLKCSDYNTIGLSGRDDELVSSWFNLVKSRGSSSKYKGEGGSFGIGKGAPFAASDIRTLFYFTKNKSGFSIFQGVAELLSFKKDGEIRRGCGSYGEDGHTSIRNLREIPERFWRKSDISSGLDVYIGGFKKQKNWETELIQSVLRNFWYAIYKKELIVEVEDIVISKNTLEKLLVNNFSGESLKDDVEPTGNPLKYYESVKNGRYYTENLKSLGNVEFYFSEIEEHMNYVAMMRKPHMVVFSKAYRYPGTYCGLFICNDKKGNQILRKMEPPAHNRWEPDSYGPTGTKVLYEIHEWIRAILKSQQKIQRKGKLDIPDAYKYLPFDDGLEKGDSKGKKDFSGQESETETARLLQKKEEPETNIKISPYRVSIINQPENTGIGGGLRGTGTKKKRGKGKGVGGEDRAKKALTYQEVSVIPIVTKKIPNGYEYLIKIYSNENRMCRLNFFAVGDEGTDRINIQHATDESGQDVHSTSNKISHIKLYKDAELKLFIQFESSNKYALKVYAYELQ